MQYPGDPVFPTSAEIPDDGIPRTASSVDVPLEALFDRTMYLLGYTGRKADWIAGADANTTYTRLRPVNVILLAALTGDRTYKLSSDDAVDGDIFEIIYTQPGQPVTLTVKDEDSDAIIGVLGDPLFPPESTASAEWPQARSARFYWHAGDAIWKILDVDRTCLRALEFIADESFNVPKGMAGAGLALLVGGGGGGGGGSGNDTTTGQYAVGGGGGAAALPVIVPFYAAENVSVEVQVGDGGAGGSGGAAGSEGSDGSHGQSSRLKVGGVTVGESLGGGGGGKGFPTIVVDVVVASKGGLPGQVVGSSNYAYNDGQPLVFPIGGGGSLPDFWNYALQSGQGGISPTSLSKTAGSNGANLFGVANLTGPGAGGLHGASDAPYQAGSGAGGGGCGFFGSGANGGKGGDGTSIGTAGAGLNGNSAAANSGAGGGGGGGAGAGFTAGNVGGTGGAGGSGRVILIFAK